MQYYELNNLDKDNIITLLDSGAVYKVHNDNINSSTDSYHYLKKFEGKFIIYRNILNEKNPAILANIEPNQFIKNHITNNKFKNGIKTDYGTKIEINNTNGIYYFNTLKELYDSGWKILNMGEDFGNASFGESSYGGKYKNKPIKTSRKYKGKDGISRVVYKKGESFYIKRKDVKTGKFVFRKVKVMGGGTDESLNTGNNLNTLRGLANAIPNSVSIPKIINVDLSNITQGKEIIKLGGNEILFDKWQSGYVVISINDKRLDTKEFKTIFDKKILKFNVELKGNNLRINDLNIDLKDFPIKDDVIAKELILYLQDQNDFYIETRYYLQNNISYINRETSYYFKLDTYNNNYKIMDNNKEISSGNFQFPKMRTYYQGLPIYPKQIKISLNKSNVLLKIEYLYNN